MSDKILSRNLYSFWPLRYSGSVQILCSADHSFVELISVDSLTYEMFFLTRSVKKNAIIYHDKQI